MASRKSPVQKRNEVVSMDDYTHTHQPAINNTLRIKLDHLKTFEPLTENQRIFFDAYKRGDYFVALHGVAGTGKTWIANNLLRYCRGLNLNCLPVASSGIASTLLDNAKTLHSQFKIPLQIYSDSICNINKNTKLGNEIINTNLIL